MNNFLFKILEIDNVLYEKIKEEISVLSNTIVTEPNRFTIIDKESTMSVLPSINNWFRNNELEVSHIAYIRAAPRLAQTAHIDYGEPELALNFPVINCNNVTTEFFHFEQQDLTIQYTPGTNLPYHHFNSDGKNIIGSFRLTQPTLLNIKMPHRVVNNTDLERISLSFRFKKDPWHLI
jgi:hypothetical protein